MKVGRMIWDIIKRCMSKPWVWIAAGVTALLALLGLRRKPTPPAPAGTVTPQQAEAERERIESEHKTTTEEIKDRHDAARKDVDKWWT